MKTKRIMVLTGALLFAGGTTMFGMGGESVEGTETKTECRAQGGEGRGAGGRQSCGDSKDCGEGQRKYRNRGKGCGEGRGQGQSRYGNRKGRGQGPCKYSKRHGKRGQRGQLMGKMLNLTEEQQTQVKALKEKNREPMQAFNKSLRDAHIAMREAAKADTVDEAKIRELSKTVADKMADAAIFRAKCANEFKALLTKEQLAKIDALKAKFAERKAKFAKLKAAREAKRSGSSPKNVKKATE
ncbi:MAG: Spy/CpxP family protein refolding chaperone [Victivallaceae bacterium]|nr:Spy/CpxP family protein refolding chaperone [Victivallaceae bacterium]